MTNQKLRNGVEVLLELAKLNKKYPKRKITPLKKSDVVLLKNFYAKHGAKLVKFLDDFEQTHASDKSLWYAPSSEIIGRAFKELK